MTNTLNKIIHNGDEYLLPQYSVVKITLPSADWNNDEQTVTVSGVTATNTIVVSPLPTSMSDYTDGGVIYTAQGTDSVTFACITTPSNDIEVNVVILAEAESGPTPPSPGRQPGANTVAYYPLDSTNTVNDLSGNNYTLINSNVTFGTNAGVDCASFSSDLTRLEGAITTIPTGASARTFSWWFYLSGYSNSWGNLFMKYGTDNTRQNWYPYIENSANHYFGLGMYDDISTTTPCSTGTWYNFICVYDGTDCILYVNGQQIVSSAKVLDTQLSNLTIGGAGSDYINGYMSQLIIEDVAWTGTEVSDYYDQTKGDYGIS